jgi:HK97 family phage portal protein
VGILDRIFKKSKTVTASKLIAEPASGFGSYGGDAYANDVYREAVDAIARNAGKLKGSHVITYANHDRTEGDCKLNRLLQVRPNPYMSAYDLLYKLVTHLYLYNNAFAYLDRDGKGNLKGIYPVTATSVNVLTDAENNLYCAFTLRSGKEVVLPYSDLVHLRRYFNDNEVLGADNSAIAPGLELAQTQNDGIISGIKAGASIRGILSFTQIMSATKLKEEKEAFVADYLSMENGTGVVATDSKMTYTPIENRPVILNADQAKEVKTKIYDYLGVTEPIVNSSYTEDQYSAFYESTLEPIATALSQEFTAKLFNDREQAYGNSILFESGRLQFTSNSTKVSLIAQLMPMGLLTINQALEILNLPSVEGGDKRLQALNMIDQDKAAQYQTGQKKTEEGGDDGQGK